MIHRSSRRQTRSALLVTLLFLLASPLASAQSQPGDPDPAADEPADEQPPPPDPVPAEAPTTFPAMGKTNELLLGENFFLRPGIQLQAWTELLQDRAKQTDGEDGAYQWNHFLRRARFFISGGIFKKVTYLFLFEGANLGRTVTAADGTSTKNFNSLLIQDATFSLNLHPAFTIQGGLFLVPFCRNILQSTATYLSLDILTTSATYIAQTQTSTLRDTGLQIKGQVLGDHLEYRLATFQGIRQSSAQEGAQGGKNPFRFSGYVQYNFLDPEVGYVFHGQYFGRKRVAGVSAGFDYQKLDGADVDAYFAYSAAAFASIPLSGDGKTGGDEIAGIVQYLHFDPGTTLQPPPAPGGVAEQDDIAAELSYYNKGIGASLFGKFELRTHSDEAFEAADLQIFGGGVKYFLAESAINLTLAYNRIDTPNADEMTVNPVNQIVGQLQIVYY